MLRAALVILGLSVASLAHAGKDVKVVVRVVDDLGAPVPSARVREVSEGEAHLVNSITGQWSTEVLYLPASEHPLAKGDVLTFEVFGPGFLLDEVVVTLSKRVNEVDVALEAFRPAVPGAPVALDDAGLAQALDAADDAEAAFAAAHTLLARSDPRAEAQADRAMQLASHALEGEAMTARGESLLAVQTLAALQRWIEADAAHLQVSTDDSLADRRIARKHLGERALTWLAFARERGLDAAVPMELCRVSVEPPSRCAP